eukprot:TRINITY_DN13629_c1_g7_i1.p1 TRINITY_DN13629_c1_g7~~TRINITY_DN13629_c1_g7_i1.p1  ORF type:complete len:610 (-),score=97.38 TRINITY_DN13629_c1_g7_i1:117-1946(-)
MHQTSGRTTHGPCGRLIAFALVASCAVAEETSPAPQAERRNRVLESVRQWGLRGSSSAPSSAAISGSPSRTLESAAPRRLACESTILALLPPPQVIDYTVCIENRSSKEDTSAAGANTAIAAECWCKHNVTKVMQDLDCCGAGDFGDQCSVQCNPDCEDAHSQKCIDECSPLCLEAHYEGEECAQTCRNEGCYEKLLCIAENSWKETLSGSRTRVCNEAAFYNSAEAKKYSDCLQEMPLRTNWQRIHAQNHCICRENLKTAAASATCCGSAFFNRSVCNKECASDADCTSTEAATCLRDCEQKCTVMNPNFVTRACNDHCLIPTAPCFKYQTCKPQKARQELEYNYVCSDNTKPNPNGCCKQTYENGVVAEGCPTLCQNKMRYVFNHGLECRCEKCPETKAAFKFELNETVVAGIYANGIKIAQAIAREVGLEHHQPTPKMLQLVKERNEQVLQTAQDLNSMTNAEAETQIAEINVRYNRYLRQQAVTDLERMQRGLDPEPVNGVGSNPGGETGRRRRGQRGGGRGGDDDHGMMMPIVATLVGLFLTLGVLFGVWKCYCRRKGSPSRLDVEPTEGDNVVVVGRPVGADGAANDVTGGAPVQQAQKKGDA